MDVNRTVVPKSQAELENVLNFESRGAQVSGIDTNPRVEEIPAIAISIVSNSRLLSEGLLPLLSPHLRLQLVATHLGAFLVSPSLPNPLGHVVLLDISVGRAAAIAWIRYWRGLIPPAYVIILELSDDIALILDCIEAGASGYTLQGASVVEVAEAINDARYGKAHCSPEVTSLLYGRMASLATTVRQLSVPPLTARESEILRHIAAGYTNLEIAAHLVIELRTVKQHVHNILGKLNIRSRGEAACFAVAQGWLSENPGTRVNRE